MNGPNITVLYLGVGRGGGGNNGGPGENVPWAIYKYTNV